MALGRGTGRKFAGIGSVDEAWPRAGTPDWAPAPTDIFDPATYQLLLGTAPFPVSGGSFNGVDQPTMAALSTGGFVVVWMDGFSVKAQRFDSEGERLGGTMSVNASFHGPQGQQHVVGLASGGFVVSWAGLDDSGLGIWARIFDANGQPVTADVRLNTETLGNEQQPGLAALSSGGFVLGWTDENGDASGYGIKAQIFDSLGARVGGELLVNTTIAANQYFPRTAGLQGGGFVVAWTSPGPIEVRAQIFDAAGAKLGNEILVGAGPGEKYFQSIAVLASGDFVIAWSNRTDGVDVKAQMFTAAGAKIGGEFPISTAASGDQDYASLAALPDGGFVATWRDATGVGNFEDDGEIKAQFFDALGARVGDEFMVNVDTQGGQILAQAAAFGTGDLAFIWMDYASGSVMARTFFSATLGTNGDDVFAGTADRDFYLGLDGNDAIGGSGGRDHLLGGAGNDRLDGGAEADVLIGEAGDDDLFGGDGNDELDGGDGDDGLDGGAGDDIVHGGAGDDTIEAGAGQDSIYGDDGNDTLSATGGGGDGDWLFGGLGNDILTASGGLFRLFGDDGGSTSEDGNDHLILTNGATGSWLDGGGGDDVLFASGIGQLTIGGGTGTNDIIVQGFTHGNAVLLDGDDMLRLPAGFFTVSLFGGRDTIVINAIGPGFMTVIGLAAGEAGDRFDLSIYGADPFGAGTLVFGGNGPNAVIDHPATGMRYVLQSVLAANLSAYNLGVPNPNYAPQGMIIDDAFADSPTIEWHGELVGADGNDLIRGFGGDDRLFGAGGDDRLEGGSGADRLFGGSAADLLFGESGDDILDGGTGSDALNGGAGDDVYFVDNAGDVVIEVANEGYDIVYAGVSYALAADSFVEVLATIDNNATTPLNLTGNALANYVTGNAGSNLLDGGAGPDQLWGRGGDDSYYADAGDDVVEYDGDGYDILYARSSYALGIGQSIEVLATIDNTATTAINLAGNAFSNYIVGNAGANTLDGGGGSDQLWGREGDDSYIADMNDIVLEYAGHGTDILYAREDYILAAGLSVEILATVDNTATTAIDLYGNELDNYLTGNAGANTLDGGTGSDTLWGRGGDDSYFADGNDVVLENAGEGSDIVYARGSFVLGVGVSVETLATVDNNATNALNLTGNELANYVTGNAGANILDGGLGADQLFGRGGADTFAFTSALGGGNVDQILDFLAGTDKIGLDDAIFAGIGTPGSFNPNAFFAGTAAHDLDDRIIYDQATGQLFFDADGSGAGAAVLFATLGGSPAIGASDFAVL